MMEREVIVVGAGPAGATAAMALAQKGRDVLLLDRQNFPRDKTCGDAVPAGAIEILYHLGMKEKIEAAGFYPVNRLLISSPKGHIFEADLKRGKEGADSYIIPRLQFDAALQAHAVASGAEFCQAQVKEPLVENGRVVGVRARADGRNLDIRARMVIGADGVTSAITRALRPRKHIDLHRAVALRAYVEDIEEFPHLVEFYLYEGILPGYAWIFPIGEGRANIGLGLRLDKYREGKRDLEEMLKVFLAMPAVKKRLKRGGDVHDVAVWQLNFGSQSNLQHAYDGALLVGDAAGFINPLTGGGIHNALISARLAADTVDEALKKGDISRPALLPYEAACHDLMWGGMRRSYFVQRWLLRFPFLLDFLVKRMNEDSTIAQIFLTKL
ncbi:MAG: NAD(P)/FAD-dependent oxidoreductase [Chloroflexota bacterium]